jgi:hypothetical protein
VSGSLVNDGTSIQVDIYSLNLVAGHGSFAIEGFDGGQGCAGLVSAGGGPPPFNLGGVFVVAGAGS